MKKRITFEEFMKLPRKKQNIRYIDLSSHDKFLARLSDVKQDNTDSIERLSKSKVKEIAKDLGIEER